VITNYSLAVQQEVQDKWGFQEGVDFADGHGPLEITDCQINHRALIMQIIPGKYL
jgi:hypothetical protein